MSLFETRPKNVKLHSPRAPHRPFESAYQFIRVIIVELSRFSDNTVVFDGEIVCIVSSSVTCPLQARQEAEEWKRARKRAERAHCPWTGVLTHTALFVSVSTPSLDPLNRRHR